MYISLICEACAALLVELKEKWREVMIRFYETETTTETDLNVDVPSQSELWRTLRLCCVSSFSSHLREVKRNHSHRCWAKSNSSISQRRNWERVFALDANGAFIQSGNHRLQYRYCQHTCFSVLCYWGSLNIRESNRCPNLSFLFSVIFNWGLIYFNFLHWYIAGHMNGNSPGLWQAVTL